MSLTQSQEDIRPQPVNKPVVKKRSLSKGRVARSKGPSKPNEKHSIYYSGLGCALKISELRTKQRLLYQMWQLVHDEAMVRLQQTFHYDYARVSTCIVIYYTYIHVRSFVLHIYPPTTFNFA